MTTEQISVADAVNRLLDKFRTSPPVFVAIGESRIVAKIGPRTYTIDFDKSYSVFETSLDSGNWHVWTESSNWVGGVLNGRVREEAGELVKGL